MFGLVVCDCLWVVVRRSTLLGKIALFCFVDLLGWSCPCLALYGMLTVLVWLAAAFVGIFAVLLQGK